jgi:hypothetical protein
MAHHLERLCEQNEGDEADQMANRMWTWRERQELASEQTWESGQRLLARAGEMLSWPIVENSNGASGLPRRRDRDYNHQARQMDTNETAFTACGSVPSFAACRPLYRHGTRRARLGRR